MSPRSPAIVEHEAGFGGKRNEKWRARGSLSNVPSGRLSWAIVFVAVCSYVVVSSDVSSGEARRLLL